MNNKRPTNLNLSDLRTIKQPVTAISSLLHRITGIVLFLAIPFLLWGLSKTLASESQYNSLTLFLDTTLGLLTVWVILVSLSYHVLAGIRHLFMDLGIGESFATAKRTSWLVISLAGLAAILWGVWLW